MEVKVMYDGPLLKNDDKQVPSLKTLALKNFQLSSELSGENFDRMISKTLSSTYTGAFNNCQAVFDTSVEYYKNNSQDKDDIEEPKSEECPLQEVRAMDDQLLLDNNDEQVPSLKSVILKYFQPSSQLYSKCFDRMISKTLSSSYTKAFKDCQAVSDTSVEYYKNNSQDKDDLEEPKSGEVPSQEIKAIDDQPLLHNNGEQVPSLKTLTLKLSQLSGENFDRMISKTLSSCYTEAFKDCQVVSDSPVEYYKINSQDKDGLEEQKPEIAPSQTVKAMDVKLLLDNNDEQVPSLKTLTLTHFQLSSQLSAETFDRMISKTLSSFPSEALKDCQAVSDSSVEYYKNNSLDKDDLEEPKFGEAASQKVKDMDDQPLLDNNDEQAPSLNTLTLRYLQISSHFSEETVDRMMSNTLCSSSSKALEDFQADSNSSVENYRNNLPEKNDLEDLEPEDVERKFILKSPELQIVMKEKNFLDHCEAVRSGARKRIKRHYVSKLSVPFDIANEEESFLRNSLHHNEEVDIQVNYDQDNDESDENELYTRKRVSDLVKYFDSKFTLD